MNQIESLVNKRIANVKILLEKVANYFDIIKDIVSSMAPRQYTKYSAAVESTRNILAEIEAGQFFKGGEPLEIAYKLYTLFSKLMENLATMVSTVSSERYPMIVSFNMSTTYVEGVQQSRKYLLTLIEKIYEMEIADDRTIISEFLTLIQVKENLAKVILFIDSHDTNKFLIELLREAIKYATGGHKQKLINMVEKQKDVLLAAGRIKIEYPGPQSPLVRYGLCPRTASMSPTELFEIIGAKWSAKADLCTNLQKAADILHVGIILINKVSSSPVEFDIRGLVSTEYILQNDLKTSTRSGLSKKILKRFNTITELPLGKNGAKGSGLSDVSSGLSDVPSVLKFVPEGSTRAYILETINGISYRLISNEAADSVDLNSIKGILDGLSTRPIEYNKLHEDEILDCCFDPKAHTILTAYADEKRAAPSSNVIKEQIIKDFTEAFEAKKPIKSAAEFQDIDADLINTILLDRLTHNLGVAGKGSTEYTLTYITKFDSIIHQFIKELDNRFKKHSPEPILFKERSGDDLQNYLSSIFNQIITEVVNELDKSRLWTEYDISIKEFFLEKKYIIV